MTDWPIKTLDALCNEGVVLLGRGNIISKKDIAANPGPYPIYSSARENEGKFGEYGDFMFDEEMITWSIDGGGRLFYRPRHKFSVTNVGGTLRVLNPKVLEIRYLHRALENLHSKKVFDWVFKAHPSVIRKVYDEIPVPPLEEQKRIVALLDAATSRITELTACYEQARTHANNLFTSALRDELEGNPDWPIKTIGEICEVFADGDWIETKDQASAGVRLIQTGNVGDGEFKDRLDKARFISESTFSRLRCTEIFPGDLLVSRLPDPVGRACLIPETGTKMITAVDCTIMRPKMGVMLSKFLVLSTQTSVYRDQVRAKITGTTRDRISRSNLGEVQMTVPPLEEQKRIVARLDAMRAKTSEMVEAYDAKLQSAKDLRQSMLEAAFAGEL